MAANEPLTAQDLDNIKKALQQLDAANSLIEKASRAGINVDAYRTRQADARDRLMKIKQAFFPTE